MTCASSDIAPTVTVILVSYNTRDMTLASLRSLYEQTAQTSLKVIVVDNQSSDGSADAIEAEFGSRLCLIRAASNLGFAAANNLAAAKAQGEYLLLLNPDTLVLDGAIDKLVAFAREQPEARVWGGRTVFADGSLNPASCWRRITLWGLFCRATGLTRAFASSRLCNPEEYGGWQRDSVRHVDIVSGCFLLIEHRLWNALGGLDSAFFMYGEEADLCLRARRHGARPQTTPAATIVHYGGASESVRTEKLVRLLRAKSMLIKRHLPSWQQPLALGLLAAWPFTRSLWQRRRTTDTPHGKDSSPAWAAAWRRRADWLRADSKGG
ncbi:MAG: glycosyltransferase family 2 protein [Phycisphaerales bacterium JB054]